MTHHDDIRASLRGAAERLQQLALKMADHPDVSDDEKRRAKEEADCLVDRCGC